MGFCILNECQNMSLWELLAWRRPKVTGIFLGIVLFFIAFFWYMNYTMVTFTCRTLQFSLLMGLLLGLAKKGQLTADDIEGAVDRVVNAVGSRAVGAAKSAYTVAVWRDARLSGGLLVASFVLSYIGNCISDSAFAATTALLAFTLPVLYETKKDEIDAWAAKCRNLMDQYLGKLNTKLSDINKKAD